MKDITCALLVIGAGPGGYVCAIRAGQLGVDTVIVDSRKPGGTCLNVGCIPSKALIHAANEFESARRFAHKNPLGITAAEPDIDLSQTVAWKDGIVRQLNNGVTSLLKRAKVKILAGQAQFRDGKTVAVETDVGRQIIHAEAVVVATGSEPVALPELPFGERVVSSAQALSLKELPASMAVVGGGYIGLELGTAFAKLGSRVTVIEFEAKLLPQWDAELTDPIDERLEELGVDIRTRTRALGLTDKGVLQLEGPAGEARIEADKLLVTVGRRPVTEGWGREELALDMEGPFLRVDESCRTPMRGIYAVGDVTGEPMLAHRAMAQGEMVAEIVAGRNQQWTRQVIPAVCFTDPEIVSVGLSPEAARGAGHDIRVGRFPYSASGRAMTMQDKAGFVRVVARDDNHVILGIQAVGRDVSELSAAFALAIEMQSRLEDIAATIHTHPTRGEAFQEAALAALGRALHV